MDDTVILSGVPVDPLFLILSKVLLLVGALFVAVPVLSALLAGLLTIGSASSVPPGYVPGGVSFFSNILLAWTSPWAVVGISLGVLGIDLRFGRP